MGLHEDAMELRKKICDVAPEYIKKELSGKPWEVALLLRVTGWRHKVQHVSIRIQCQIWMSCAQHTVQADLSYT